MIIGIAGKKRSGKDTVGKIIQYLTNSRKDYRKYYSGEDVKTFKDFLNLDKEYNISQYSSWRIKKFAYKVKQILSILTGIPVEDMEKEEVKNSYLGEEWDRWEVGINEDANLFDGNCLMENAYFSSEQEAKNYINKYKVINFTSISLQKITVRQAMQMIGTDLFRDKFHPNTWINALMSDYRPFIERFPNLIKSNNKPLIEGNSYKMGKAINPNWIITDCRFPDEAQAIKDREGILIRVNRDTGLEDDHISETALDDYTDFHYTIDNNGTIGELIDKVKEILIKEKIL